MTELLANRYILGDALGAGGMARVVRAHDRILDRPVAVKILRQDVVPGPDGRERFLREARAAASFSHPNAVAVYDIGRDGGTSFIVMELVEGSSLAETMAARGQIRQEEAVAVTAQVLSALSAAHDRGLVHRDVKPANILLPGGRLPTSPSTPQGPKLADFGIAKGAQEAAAGLTLAGQVLGTPKYVSPEQVSGAAATPQSDVYSMGVVLYEMLAGRAPFEGEAALSVALAHREDPVPKLERFRKGLDPGLVQVVDRALRKDPAQRFHSADDMRAALLSGAPTTVAIGAAPAPGVARTRTLAMGAGAASGAAGRRTGAQAADPPLPSGRPWRAMVLLGILAFAAIVALTVDWGAMAERVLPDGAGIPGPVEPTEGPEEPEPAESDETEPDPTEAETQEPEPTPTAEPAEPTAEPTTEPEQTTEPLPDLPTADPSPEDDQADDQADDDGGGAP